MFANSAARAGPTRAIAVNQSMFVRKIGPTTEKANDEPQLPADVRDVLSGELGRC